MRAATSPPSPKARKQLTTSRNSPWGGISVTPGARNGAPSVGAASHDAGHRGRRAASPAPPEAPRGKVSP